MDAGQRSVLFLDVLRRRGVQYREHLAESAPHVLDYSVELIVDGRMLPRPVNYALVRNSFPSIFSDNAIRDLTFGIRDISLQVQLQRGYLYAPRPKLPDGMILRGASRTCPR